MLLLDDEVIRETFPGIRRWSSSVEMSEGSRRSVWIVLGLDDFRLHLSCEHPEKTSSDGRTGFARASRSRLGKLGLGWERTSGMHVVILTRRRRRRFWMLLGHLSDELDGAGKRTERRGGLSEGFVREKSWRVDLHARHVVLEPFPDSRVVVVLEHDLKEGDERKSVSRRVDRSDGRRKDSRFDPRSTR